MQSSFQKNGGRSTTIVVAFCIWNHLESCRHALYGTNRLKENRSLIMPKTNFIGCISSKGMHWGHHEPGKSQHDLGANKKDAEIRIMGEIGHETHHESCMAEISSIDGLHIDRLINWWATSRSINIPLDWLTDWWTTYRWINRSRGYIFCRIWAHVGPRRGQYILHPSLFVLLLWEKNEKHNKLVRATFGIMPN